MRRRRIAIVLLALGTVGGYASGIASLRHCHGDRQAAWERHVAEVCVQAAQGGKGAAAADETP
jgi:hypothetical protein